MYVTKFVQKNLSTADNNIKMIKNSRSGVLSAAEINEIESAQYAKADKAIMLETDALLEEYGWVKIPQSEENTISPRTTSANAQISSSIYVNTQTGAYRAESTLAWSQMDELHDAEDIISIGADKNLNIRQTYGNSYSRTGINTGTSSNGSWSSWSLITDRKTESNGFLWNVIDEYHQAYKVTVSIYFELTGHAKLYSSYAHNYKTKETQVSASIGNSGLQALNGQLTISYNTVNSAWGPIQGPLMNTQYPDNP